MNRHRMQRVLAQLLNRILSSQIRHVAETASWLSLVMLLVYAGVNQKIAPALVSLLVAPAKASRIITAARSNRQFENTMRVLEQQIALIEDENYQLASDKQLLIQTEEQMFVQIKNQIKQLEQMGQQILDKEERIALVTQEVEDLTHRLYQFDEYTKKQQEVISNLQVTQSVHRERMSEQASIYQDKINQRDHTIAELKAELATVKAEFKTRRQQLDNDLHTIERLMAQMEGENNLLKNQIAELMAPKRLQPTTWYNDLGNRVCDWIGEGGHHLHLERVEEDHGLVSLFFRPMKRHSIVSIEGMKEDMRIEFQLIRNPSVKVQSDGTVALHLYTDRNASSPEERIIKPVENWLEKALILDKNGNPRANHARFVGESESGKSSLVNNCIGLNKQYFPDLRVVLADPLYDSKTEEEQQRDWSVTPDYKNDKECLEGLVWLDLELERRKKKADRKKQVVIFILDEVDTMATDYPEIVTVIKKIWKQGRHVNLYLWIVGQSPLVKPLNLGVMDVNNAICFYLNQTIVRGLADAFIPADVMVRWQNQYHQRQNNKERYIVFVRPKQELPFMANPPEPGTYNTVALAEDHRRYESPPSYQDLEFNIDDAKRRLERSFEDTDPIEVRIKELHKQGKKPYEIVKEIWGFSPSRSPKYKERLKYVQDILKSE